MTIPTRVAVVLRSFIVWNLLWTCLSFNLTILHTNDVHARYDQTNKYSGQCSDSDALEGKCVGGIARLYTKVKELRAAHPNTVFLDAGDQYQGTVWFYTYRGNITTHFMNVLGYDVMALGNHEFDRGPEGLRPLMTQANFTILSANINTSAVPDIFTNLLPSVVKETGGEKVGFIGYTTAETREISQPAPVTFIDEAEAIQREVDRLTAQGVNKIIAVGHAGFAHDMKLARNVTGLDVIVGGHTNTFLYTGKAPSDTEESVGPYPTVVDHPDGSKVLIVQDYAYAKYLGFLQVEFDDAGKVISWSGNPILLDNNTTSDPGILADLARWRARIDAEMNVILGRTAVFLEGDSYICRQRECNMGNLITDAMVRQNIRHSDGEEWNHVAIAIHNSGGIRAPISKGDIDLADILSVQPFQHNYDIVELNGSAILLFLEHSASRWEKIHGAFLQISGLQIVYDMSKPVSQRVQEVKVKCADCPVPQFVDLDLSKVYKIVMPNFVANGGDGYDMIVKNTLRRHINGDLDTDVLTEYINTYSPIIHGLEGRIRFVNSSAIPDRNCTIQIPAGMCIKPCGIGGAAPLPGATVALVMTIVIMLSMLML